MAETVLRLDADDVWRTLESLDPVAVLAEELIKRVIDHPDRGRESARRLVPWTGQDDQYVLAENLPRGVRCAMPSTALRMAHTAALAALATRRLLPPGGLTVAMLGTRRATQAQLAILVRHVPDIVHVAVRLTDKPEPDPLTPQLLDQLDLAGIGLSVLTTVTEALFGANLVVAVSEDALSEGAEHAVTKNLARGTVLVNASGHDLPAGLVDHVDQIYVDDLALLPEHPDRHIVAQHLARSDDGAPWAGELGRPPGIAADLGLMLVGAHPGRERQDDIVVVELLSADDPNPQLAHLVAETAVRGGLGVRVPA